MPPISISGDGESRGGRVDATLPRWSAILAAAVVLTGLAYGLSAYPLLEPDEGRNAEVAREMAESNDYVLPRLNGLPYLDKPILYFFVDAAAMEVLGPTVLAARLPSLLFTLLTLGLVWLFAHTVIGRGAGTVAAVATGSMPLTLGFARTVIFDSTLTFFVAGSIMAFHAAIEQPPGETTEGKSGAGFWWAVTGWAAMALGVLTKGPVAIAVPLLVVLPYAVWRRRAGRLFNIVALLAFTAILLPWIRAMSVRIPDFLEYSLVTETYLRLTTDQMNRTGPLWYFLPILVVGSLPWSAVVLGGLAGIVRGSDPRIRDRLVFLVCWLIVPLLFFSLSQSKRPQYILPLMAPVGLLVALMWNRRHARPAGLRTAAITVALLGIALIATGGLLGRIFEASPGVAATIPGTGLRLGVVCLLAGLVTRAFPRREIVVLTLALPVAAIPVCAGALMKAIGTERSTAGLAAVINTVRSSDTEIVTIETYPLSLAFYLRTKLTISTADGAELTSNYLFRTLDRWRAIPESTLRPPGWWREQVALCDRPRLFVAKNHDSETRDVLRQALPLLAQNHRVAVYGPCDAALLARGNSAPADASVPPGRSAGGAR